MRLKKTNNNKKITKKVKKMEVNAEFRKQAMGFHIEPDLIKYCYQCSKCSDNCPVTAVTADSYTTQG